MTMHRRLPTLAAVLLLCLAACSSPPPPGSAPLQGSVQLAATTQQALSSSDVTRIKVTISAPDMTSMVVDLAQTNGSWAGFISNVPAGTNRTFLAEAFDASRTLRFQGQASGVAISPNQTTAVALTLQELSSLPPYANEAPLIDSVVASVTTVQTGESLSLTATAHDPNADDSLSLAWTATGGTFSAPSSATTSWTAPSSTGIQTLTLIVTDSQGIAVSVSLAINVISGAPTNAELAISFNLLPVLSQIGSSLSRLEAGQSTSVSALASDTDGDALSYQWVSSCPGTWTNATASTASFVPSTVPASPCNNCRLTVTIRDARGGQTTGSLNLCVAAPFSPERFPPRFTNFHPSASSISPGQTVTLDVTALDPQASSLTFTWNATTGALAAPQSTTDTSRALWTAPACAATGSTPTITATVSNAYGLSASISFALSGLPTCASGFSPAGSMASARSAHTATLLPSGKVLIAGGGNGSTQFASTELYDPATNTWASAPAMASARYNHTATRLPSGKVLVAGGRNGSSQLSSVELYNPATNSWASAPAMAAVRYNHTATLLPSGKVLVVGGHNSTTTLASVEVYDPATNTWASAAAMSSARGDHTATLLTSGKVFVAGGAQTGGSQLSSAEVYDPATNSWAPAGTLSTPLTLHTATLLPSGKVLLAGGYYIIGRPYAQLYDPATNSLTSTTYMTTARAAPTATLLPSGKVLVSGGDNNSGPPSSAEVYDPATSTWASAGALASPRYTFAATLLPSGQVLVAGGYRSGGTYISSAELYSP